MLAVSRSEETNGTKFLVTSTNASARASMNPLDNQSAYDFAPSPIAWEFDIVEYSGTGNIQAQFLQNTSPLINKVFSLKNSNYVGKTIKIVYTGSKLELYVDGEHQTGDITVTFDSGSNVRVSFAFGTKDDYLIVKNVKAYPI